MSTPTRSLVRSPTRTTWRPSVDLVDPWDDSEQPTTLAVTVCQLDDRMDQRSETMAALARHLSATGSDILVLPELPFSPWLAAEPVPDAAAWRAGVDQHAEAVGRLSELAVNSVVASRPTGSGETARNQAFTWTPSGGPARLRDKYYLPNEPGYWEASWYSRGALSFETARLLGATVAVPLCTDLWFFDSARQYARAGVDLLCLPRATPMSSLSTWLAGGQVAAICSGAYCLSSNQWTRSGSGPNMGGVGWAIDPDGVVLATTSRDEPFVTVTVDLEATARAKGSYPRSVAQ